MQWLWDDPRSKDVFCDFEKYILKYGKYIFLVDDDAWVRVAETEHKAAAVVR